MYINIYTCYYNQKKTLMGLDMYLTKKTYIGAYFAHRKVEGKIEITADGNPVPIKLKRVSEISEQIASWRKANQIHNWFVNNVQEGVDDCGEYYVNEETLKKLLEECKEVEKSPDKATEKMPTKEGFFFGGVEYDEYYMEGVKKTISIIERILEEGDVRDIYYSSSW